ncbi:23S rRNA (uracil(1939)-C(5))-methyltransferase RlmD [uncultured Arcticibacterium sp.]|uniref:23S rRNA (uracil(1939)-C(5))-methyltransferase RlmD n=1 Tax=uncultured Arcticibacterium sp. TaxID=2173042 RepID=UPI0030F93D02
MARRKTRKVIDEIEVLDFAAEGKCLTKQDGEVIFITTPNIAPGDIVKLQVNRKRKSFSEAIVLERIKDSADRVEPFCSHFGVCGGCKWQHISYPDQLAQKEKQVRDQLVRLGKIDISNMKPILASKKTQFYRNKLEFTFSSTRWLTADEISSSNDLGDRNALGFHIPKRFDKVLPIDTCYLQEDPSNDIRRFFDEYARNSDQAFYNHVKHEGFFRTLMIRTSSTGDVMVVVQFAKDEKDLIEACLSAFVEKFPDITSVNYFINQKKNDSYQDLESFFFSGKPFIEEEMEGLRFRIGVKSFYQTNSEQAYELYKAARQLAEISKDDVVYDLYTGTGTIANFVAHQAKKVVGVEYVEDAIKDAKINSEVNGIENTSFYAGNMKDVLNDAFIEKEGLPSVIITDPPRAGMDKEVVDTLLRIAADRIVYVSCNAATQARDVALLLEKYTVEEVQPVDMFPHTHHVENIVKLKLKK